MTGTSSINTNTETSSDTNVPISFLVNAPSGTKVYKNGGLKFENGLSKTVSYRVDLKKNDYIKITTTANKIEMENTNDFAIDLEMTKGETTYGSQINAKSKKTISIMSEKIFVSKTEIKTNDESKKEDTKNIVVTIDCDCVEKLTINDTPYTFSAIERYKRTITCKPKEGTSNFDLKVENTNDFEITLKEEGGDIVNIKENKKDIITLTKSTKFAVSKKLVEKPLETDLSKSEVVNFKLYADEGTKLKLITIISTAPHGIGSSSHFTTIEKEIKTTPLTISFKSSDEYFIVESGGNVELENLNNFPITVKIEDSSKFIFHRNSKTIRKPLKLQLNVSKIFVSKKSQSENVSSRSEPELAKFTLDVYAEEGVKLLKNEKTYFLFTKKKLSGVKVNLQDNDTIGLDKDEDFNIDPDLGEATQYTIGSPKIREKKRRLIVRNRNDFPIIVIEEKNSKTYIIASSSKTFIFFGKEASKLYLLKGDATSAKQLRPQTKQISPIGGQIILYISFSPLPATGSITVTLSEDKSNKATGSTDKIGESIKYSEPFQIELSNKQTLEFSLQGIPRLDTVLIIGSDPSNRNVMFTEENMGENKGSKPFIIRPGGSYYKQLELNSIYNSKKKFKVTNRLLQQISIYETTDFRIPFQIVPYVRMITSITADILNTSLYELQNELNKERKRKGTVGDCEILTKMLYSTFYPSYDDLPYLDKLPSIKLPFDIKKYFKYSQKTASAWAFAILFSNERGLDNVLIMMMALSKKFAALGKYLIVEKITEAFINELKKSAYYKSKVIDLLKRNFSSFLFEFNISDDGFIVCMYRSAKDESIWESPWNWLLQGLPLS